MNYPVNILAERLPNICTDGKMLENFDKYACLLEVWNQKINLTAITEPSQVVIKHFLDSIILLEYVKLKKGASIIDVGTGAGFPGIPLKIVRPDLNLTLLDSLNKRLIFLNEVCSQLSLDSATIHARAEEGGRDKKLRERYDYATARAVAHLRELSEYCLPFVKVGGSFIALKGADAEEELKESAVAIKKLGGHVENVFTFNLGAAGGRTIIEIKKDGHTPMEFPRQTAKIKSKPLN